MENLPFHNNKINIIWTSSSTYFVLLVSRNNECGWWALLPILLCVCQFDANLVFPNCSPAALCQPFDLRVSLLKTFKCYNKWLRSPKIASTCVNRHYHCVCAWLSFAHHNTCINIIKSVDCHKSASRHNHALHRDSREKIILSYLYIQLLGYWKRQRRQSASTQRNETKRANAIRIIIIAPCTLCALLTRVWGGVGRRGVWCSCRSRMHGC